MNDTSKKSKDGVEGEGSYSATRDYNERTAEFIKKGKVDQAAQDAKQAMDSSEAADLKVAEEKGKAGDPRGLDKSK
ncbi:MAG: hypothetical protein KIS73_10415 [Enhydrobacter sp.]|nr:hypothetical protein [Enhydrobacter sp.]